MTLAAAGIGRSIDRKRGAMKVGICAAKGRGAQVKAPIRIRWGLWPSPSIGPSPLSHPSIPSLFHPPSPPDAVHVYPSTNSVRLDPLGALGSTWQGPLAFAPTKWSDVDASLPPSLFELWEVVSGEKGRQKVNVVWMGGVLVSIPGNTKFYYCSKTFSTNLRLNDCSKYCYNFTNVTDHWIINRI